MHGGQTEWTVNGQKKVAENNRKQAAHYFYIILYVYWRWRNELGESVLTNIGDLPDKGGSEVKKPFYIFFFFANSDGR